MDFIIDTKKKSVMKINRNVRILDCIVTIFNLIGSILLAFQDTYSIEISATIINGINILFLNTILIFSVFSIRSTIKVSYYALPNETLVIIHLVNYTFSTILIISGYILLCLLLKTESELKNLKL